MNRLTQKNDRGEWGLKGVSWKQLMPGEKITRITNGFLYGALYKLMRYEDTGLTPEQIREMDELYHEKCIEVKRLKDRLAHAEDQWSVWSEAYQKDVRAWIPVEEQLPKEDRFVLLSFDNFSMPLIGRYEIDEDGGSFYVGDDEESCSSQRLFVNAWMPLPERYRQEDLKEAGGAAG